MSEQVNELTNSWKIALRTRLEIHELLKQLYTITEKELSFLDDVSLRVALTKHPEYSVCERVAHANLSYLSNLRDGTIREYLESSRSRINQTLKSVI